MCRGACSRLSQRRRRRGVIRAHAARASRVSLSPTTMFARNKNWEAILDRIIQLKRRDHLKINLIMQVDTMCHKIPNFVEKSVRAAARKFSSGSRTSSRQSEGASRVRFASPNTARCCRRGSAAKVRPTPATSWVSRPTRPRACERDMRQFQRELPSRHHGILHADAAARIEGSPGDVPARRADGSGHNKYDAEHATATIRG